MKVWQADFYKRPFQDEQGQTIWELLICDSQGYLVCSSQCPQSQANSDWIIKQIEEAAQSKIPDVIQVFRPQSLGILTLAAEKLHIKTEATRYTTYLKKELKKRSQEYNHDLMKLETSVPSPLPENLWGEKWRFAKIAAGEIVETFSDRPIPIINIPEILHPRNRGIASIVEVPGVIIYAGRKSLQLARWLQESNPFALNYIPNDIKQSGGLVLEAGLVERWILATFEDQQFAQAGIDYQQGKLASQGLHFLLVQPDDSGITSTGFWLLAEEIS